LVIRGNRSRGGIKRWKWSVEGLLGWNEVNGKCGHGKPLGFTLAVRRGVDDQEGG
jgi:hypothetical protein